MKVALIIASIVAVFNVSVTSEASLSSTNKATVDGLPSLVAQMESKNDFHSRHPQQRRRFVQAAGPVGNECLKKPLLSITKRGRGILTMLYGLSGIDVFANIQTEHYQAACFIIYDDPKRLDSNDSYLIQRFILVLMSYILHIDKDDFGLATCEWDFVFCRNAGFVTHLRLSNKNLSGWIPTELGWLTTLTYFASSKNKIGGSIPEEIGRLTNIKRMYLSENELTGKIPTAFGKLNQLIFLNLNNNFLSGDCPVLPKSIISFNMKFNMLSGTIPYSVGDDLTNMKVFSGDSNMFTGTIPRNIGNCKNLKTVRLSDNQMTGTLPESLASLASLERVYLDSNQFNGTLPSKFESLLVLDVFNNTFSGTIPSFGGASCRLTDINLSQNSFNGSLPSTLSACDDINLLDLEGNKLTGEIPSELDTLSNLDVFLLYDNDITGVVPIVNCSRFTRLTADCGTPQKVKCACCKTCTDMFVTQYDMFSTSNTYPCTSTEIYIKVKGLDAIKAYWTEFTTTFNDVDSWITDYGKDMDETIYCTSFSECIDVDLNTGSGVSGNEYFVVQTNTGTNFDIQNTTKALIGYSSSEGDIQKGSCDSIFVCDFVLKRDSKERKIFGMLVKAVGITRLPLPETSEHTALCAWMNLHLNKQNDNAEDEISSLPSVIPTIQPTYTDTYTTTPTFQYYMMRMLYLNNGGSNWVDRTGWNSSSNDDYCTWFGIVCDEIRVIKSLNLAKNNLVGGISIKYFNLAGLQNLNISDNALTGEIEFLLRLSMLESIDISGNVFTGTIPHKVLNFDGLRSITMSDNKLSSTIPSDILLLTDLEILDLGNNAFEEKLPMLSTTLKKLRIFNASTNLFSGLTDDFKNMKEIEVLDLSSNKFEGTLPISKNHAKLEIFRLNLNQFEGIIDSTIGSLSHLQELLLNGNGLSGPLPPQLVNLRHLSKLSVAWNELSGGVPSFEYAKNLSLLHLHSNKFEGSIECLEFPDSIADCALGEGVVCANCAVCCRSDDECINMTKVWPRKGTFPYLHQSTDLALLRTFEFILFTFFELWLFCLVIAGASYIYLSITGKLNVTYDVYQQFQPKSIRRMFFSGNRFAISIAVVEVVLQHIFLSQFLTSTIFDAPDSDWEFALSCPAERLDCKDNDTSTSWGLAVVVISNVLFLVGDFLDGWQLMCWGWRNNKYGSIILGVYLIYIDIASVLVASLYLVAFTVSDSELLFDITMILFLTDLDERMYAGFFHGCPALVRKLEQHIISSIQEVENNTINIVNGDATKNNGILHPTRRLTFDMQKESEDEIIEKFELYLRQIMTGDE